MASCKKEPQTYTAVISFSANCTSNPSLLPVIKWTDGKNSGEHQTIKNNGTHSYERSIKANDKFKIKMWVPNNTIERFKVRVSLWDKESNGGVFYTSTYMYIKQGVNEVEISGKFTE